MKRRFQTNYKFKEGYKKFIEEIIHQGYARESEKNKRDGRIWCLPHHDIYHPNKPKTLRVIFEFSAELDERPINK